VLGRSSEVRKTPLGQSLAELGGREMTRYLWKELERLGATATLGSRAERLLAGWSGDGYTAVWALTISELVALTEQSGASRVIPLADIEGVVRPADGTLRVLVGGARFVTFRSPDAGIDAFARAVADRAHVPLGGVDALFSADGLVVLAGTPSRVTGYYLGGFRDLPAGPVAVMFDDAGVHLVPFATPWWQTFALAWADVAVTLCEAQCPVTPGVRQIHLVFDDPYGRSLDEVRGIRDRIEAGVTTLAGELG